MLFLYSEEVLVSAQQINLAVAKAKEIISGVITKYRGTNNTFIYSYSDTLCIIFWP